MRRLFLKLLAGGAACTALLPFRSVLAAATSMSVSVTKFHALKRPAVESTKAAGAAMMALARAGSRVIAAGERGIVLLSDNEGSTWRQAAVPVSVTLTALYFVNDRQGWAVGHMGVILHTSDGGEHWVVQLDGIRAARIAFDTAQAASGADKDDKSLAWAQVLVDDGPDKPFLDVFFQNERTGYAVGAYNLAFRTDDGGQTWHCWMTHLDNPKGLHLYAIRAVESNLFITGEQGLLLRSTDLGQRFSAAASPSKGTFFGLVPGPQGEMLLYGLRGRVFLSTDAGQAWSEVDSGTHATLSAGVRLEDGSLLLASQAGELMMSRDGGRTFKSTSSSVALPVSALLQTAGKRLAIATLRGMRTAPAPALPL